MSHKYDEFYRNLADQCVVQQITVREAERLGLRATLIKLQDIHAATREIADNVMAKIEAAQVAAMLEGEEDDTVLRRNFLADTAALPPLVREQATAFPFRDSTAVFHNEVYFATAPDPKGPTGPEAAGTIEAGPAAGTTDPTEGE